MILKPQTPAHRDHIREQFEAILPGFNNYRVKLGRGSGYAAMVFIDNRFYFSHDGMVFHKSSLDAREVPPHSITIEGFRP